MQSPDIFADEDDRNSDDSFENFVATPLTSRRRSAAILSQEDSFDLATGNEQVTVIENRPDDTVLMEEDDVEFDNSEETINRLLESSYEEDEGRDERVPSANDALTNLLKSFRADTTTDRLNEPEEQDHEEEESNMSIDVFADENDDDYGEAAESANEEGATATRNEPEDNEMEDCETTLLPVALPDGKEIEQPAKRRRLNPPECAPSTSSDGPAVFISSNTGEYWQQQTKSIEIHGQNFEMNSYNDYMRMKITKLNHQVNREKSKPSETVSEIFKGYSVFVNGYTEPPALVIRDLMLAHGGEYHCYYMHGITSYTIASSIAAAKIKNIREKEIFIKADWITESIAAGKPLDYRDYLIYEKGSQEKGEMRQFLMRSNPNQNKNAEDTNNTTNGFLDARNPNFIRDYYARSRLHLISTMAQDMKDFVANLKMDGKLMEKCFDEQELRELKGNSSDSLVGQNIVFHVDLDCFFVSVAVRDREDLKTKEVAITHSKGTISNSMSEIASCSYAARSCGVKNGMLVRDALQKCPQLTLLPYQFDDYVSVSRQIYEILASYTLELRAVSCDEMYINVGRLCQEYGITDPTLLAEHIRKVIRAKTRCPASVGIGATSLLARLATRHAKPDGVYWVTEDKRSEFMVNEKVRDLPGLGYQMMDRLTTCMGEITTCGQLQTRSERDLVPVFGPKLAAKIFKQCRGTEEDGEDFWKTQLRKSVSCDINYGIRFSKRSELLQLMQAIGAELERKLTDCKMSAGSVTLKLMVRAADAPQQTAKFMGHGMCDTFTKTSNISVPTYRSEILYSETMKLYNKISPKLEDLRGVGVICGKLKSKMRKDVVTAVQQMFEKTKRNEGETETRQVLPEDDEEDEEDMRHKFVDQASHPLPEQKTREIPRIQDLKSAEGVVVPDILNLTEIQLRRTIRKIKEDGKGKTDFISKMEVFLKNEPSEATVQTIHSALKSLLRIGKLATFENILRKFEDISMDSQKSHVFWFDAFHIINQNLKEESKKLYEFPIDTLETRVPKRVESPVESVESSSRSRTPQRFVPQQIIVVDSTNRSL